MTRSQTILIASCGSAALLIGAFAFQHLGGLAPCKLCLWQRWPHGAALLLGVLALGLSGRLWPLAGALAMLGSAAIAGYHTGVERGWWEGPASCSAADISGLSTEQLLAQIMTAPVVRCDEVPWDMLGLSMASWNGLLSLGLAGLWLTALRAPS